MLQSDSALQHIRPESLTFRVVRTVSMTEKFGGYILGDRIGVGGMAEVFLARYVGVEGFEKDIVIKRIRPHLTEIPAFVAMFLAEAKLAARLNHPNIVQIYDLGKIDGTYFIAMEYIAGRDLSAIIPKTIQSRIPFPWEYVMKIGSSACEALYHAHTQADTYGVPMRVVHRDLSPENIRVAWTGGVKILDFGIAKAATELRQTKSGEIKGKVSYMSPEQVQGGDVDHRSDIFALGIVLYECLVSIKLFSGANDLAVMQNVLEGKIYPPSYFRPDVPEEIERIVMRALSRDVRKRYQSAADMQLDIDRFLATLEFVPSNIHLSNFLKQLFKDELEDEQARHQRLPKAQTQISAVPNITQVGAAAASTLMTLPLPDDAAQKLARLAERRQVPAEDIAVDILQHYLKYSE